jgi:hypothetical protein
MPAPFTIFNPVTNVPVATFDENGDLYLYGAVTVDGAISTDRRSILPGSNPAADGAVTSVNGLTGAVVLTASSLSALAAANNLSDVASAATARSNLGLGAVATEGYISGQYLTTPTVLAPAGATSLTSASATLAAITPAATTVAAGSNGGEISAVATWASPSPGVLDVATTTAWPSSGTVTVAASGATTAVLTYTGIATGQLTGCQYVSGSPAGTVSTGGAVTLTSSAVTTGPFTAVSASALVTASFVYNQTGSDAVAFALAAHGQAGPVVGNVVTANSNSQTTAVPLSIPFLVTGLTPGDSYNYDLLFAIAGGGSVAVRVLGQTSTTPTGESGYGPAVMTVQAV